MFQLCKLAMLINLIAAGSNDATTNELDDGLVSMWGSSAKKRF